MPVVSDSSPLILFARTGRIELLHDALGEIFIPPAVRQEVLAGDGMRPGAREVASATWIIPRTLVHQPGGYGIPQRLGTGEAETIALTLELEGPQLAIMDDAAGRRAAQALGVNVIGSAGVVLLAKERGLVPSVRPILDDLRQAGLYLGARAYGELLTRSGEMREPS